MTRKLILLDLALVALLGYLGWQMRREWVEAHARAQAFLSTKVVAGAAPVACPRCRRSRRSPRLPTPKWRS